MWGAFTAIIFVFRVPDKRREKRVITEAASAQSVMYLIVLIWKDKLTNGFFNISTNGFFEQIGRAYTPIEVLALLSPMSFPLKTDNYKMKIITVIKICIMASQLIFFFYLI